MGDPILFIALAIIALGSALGMLLSQNAVHSALFLILNLGTVAVLYVVLNAPFVAMVQVIIYAGAIMVLFLFVIMLLGVERLSGARQWQGWQMPLALILAVALLVSFAFVLLGREWAAPAAGALPPLDSSPRALGLLLFEAYVLPFQVVSVLLLVAMIGVMVLRAKRGQDA